MAPQATIELVVDPTWDDLREFWIQHHFRPQTWRHRWLARYSWRSDVVAALMCLGAALALFLLFRTPLALAAGLVVFGAILFWYLVGRRQAPERTTDRLWIEARSHPSLAGMVGARTLTFDETGMTVKHGERVSGVRWCAIFDIREHLGSIYIYESPNRAVLVPARNLDSGESRDLYQAFEGWRAAARAPSDVPDPGGEIQSPPFSLGKQEFRAGARMGRPSPWPRLRETPHIVISALLLVSSAPRLPSATAVALCLLGGSGLVWRVFGKHMWTWWAVRKVTNAQLAHSPAGVSGIRLGFGPNGVFEASNGSQGFEPWSAIWRVEPGEHHTVFGMTTGASYVLPASAFSSQDEYFDFVERALEFRRAAIASAA